MILLPFVASHTDFQCALHHLSAIYPVQWACASVYYHLCSARSPLMLKSGCRFCQMMWRLNFLVTMTCIVLQNSYMLYYICPMHTLFTIMVYAALGVGSQFNATRVGIVSK